MRNISFLMTLAALLASAPRPAAAQSRDERDVRALLDRAIQAANTVDEKAWRQSLAEYSGSGGPFFPPFEMSATSVPEVEKLVLQNLSQLRASRYTATSPINVRIDKNSAWATYTWNTAYDFKDGTHAEVDGRATFTFVREGKYWRIAHWHTSLVAPPPLTASTRDAEAQKLIEVERNAWEAIKNKQPSALANYFAEDASVLLEGQAYRITGKDNLMHGLTDFVESTELRSYQMLEPQVQVLGDTSLLTYYFTESGVSGGKEFSSAGKISIVFVKQQGAWRVLHEHRSVNR